MSMKWTAAIGLIYLIYWIMLTYGKTTFRYSQFVPAKTRTPAVADLLLIQFVAPTSIDICP